MTTNTTTLSFAETAGYMYTENVSLANLAQKFGIKNHKAHSAIGDALTLKHVLEKMAVEYEINVFQVSCTTTKCNNSN
jgi:DNA polymerase III epsilon subunit-like protein